MAEVTAALVRELRDMTGAGMMDCKKALEEAAGNVESAKEWLRKKGMKDAGKKAGRIAAEGIVYSQPVAGGAVLLELNCETDFVAKGDDFKALAAALAKDIELSNAKDSEVSATAQELVTSGISKIGEKIDLRRFVRFQTDGLAFSYIHPGDRIGVLVEVVGAAADVLTPVAKSLAMHIAWAKPSFISREDVPADVIAKEKEILAAQLKPEQQKMADKILEGKLSKFFEENCLLHQIDATDGKRTIGDLVKQAGASVKRFQRYEVGEGIEKAKTNFVEEVQAAAGLA